MSKERVSIFNDPTQQQNFTRSLLKDLQALEYMLENDWFENDIVRFGAEQEFILVDKKTYKPAYINLEILEKMKDKDWITTELARFNLEINMTPRKLSDNNLTLMENEIKSMMGEVKQKLDEHNATYVLVGILPTLQKFNLHLDSLTPNKRYSALMEALNAQRTSGDYELNFTGIDELKVNHSSALLEAANTSFQVHLQVSSKEFVKMYNIAQAVCGPTMALAANSSLVFGKRLWQESRIAMFQQAIDTRSTKDHLREQSSRVSFGKEWLDQSVLEIYRDDVSRFRVLLNPETMPDSLADIEQGKVPKLSSLLVHNSTIYRWNRPCYGISDNGKPHLRIENRVIPSGPTIADEMANAAFWLGTMVGMKDRIDDIRKHLSFADVRDNFVKSAQFGIDSKFNWFNDQKISACDLALNELIPLAEEGLKTYGIDSSDIDKYLGIIKERATKHTNGARWMLRSFTKLKDESNVDEALSVVTHAIIENQQKEIPGHEWEIPRLEDYQGYIPLNMRVSECMETDFTTVHESDIIELVGELMSWKDINYTPVEDKNGNLIGLVTNKQIMKSLIKKKNSSSDEDVTVRDIMITEPITVKESDDMMEAMRLIQKHKINCLPVVNGKELIGVVSDRMFLDISSRLMERLNVLKDKKSDLT